MTKEPSVAASSITLTVSAFVEMDMPTTIPKISMDDLMTLNDLEKNFRVMSWSSCGDDSCGLQPKDLRNCGVLPKIQRLSVAELKSRGSPSIDPDQYNEAS
jgi:hypothetical protein